MHQLLPTSCSTAEDPSLVLMVQEQCWEKERHWSKAKTCSASKHQETQPLAQLTRKRIYFHNTS